MGDEARRTFGAVEGEEPNGDKAQAEPLNGGIGKPSLKNKDTGCQEDLLECPPGKDDGWIVDEGVGSDPFGHQVFIKALLHRILRSDQLGELFDNFGQEQQRSSTDDRNGPHHRFASGDFEDPKEN